MNGRKTLFSQPELELMRNTLETARKEAQEALKDLRRAKRTARSHTLPDRRLKAHKRLSKLSDYARSCVWAYREARNEFLEVREHRRAA